MWKWRGLHKCGLARSHNSTIARKQQGLAWLKYRRHEAGRFPLVRNAADKPHLGPTVASKACGVIS